MRKYNNQRFNHFQIGPVRHLGFDRKWILTIQWPLWTHNTPAYHFSECLCPDGSMTDLQVKWPNWR